MNGGISNMGGNMQGTPITQLLNNTKKDAIKNMSDINKIVSQLNEENNEEKNNKKRKKVETDTDTDTEENKKKIKKQKKQKKKEEDDDYDDYDDYNTDTKYSDYKVKKSKKGNNINKTYIFDLIKDGGIFIVLYIILSTGFVKTNIGKVLKVINPNEEGVVSLKGIASYGLVLVVLFMISKTGLVYFNKY